MTARRGSALLVTLVITGVIGITLAGLGRLVATHLRTSSALADSSIAFSAAEAGIEEGLLRWRFDRNIEVPTLAGQDLQESTRQASRVDMTSGSVTTPVGLGENVSRTSDHSRYDLRMWYKAPEVGSQADLASATYLYRLTKDQSLDLDVSELAGQTIIFQYQLGAGQTGCVLVEAKVFQQASDGSLTEEKTVSSQTSETKLPISISNGATGYRLRIRPFIFAACGPTNPAPDTAFIAYSIKVDGLSPSRSDKLLDTGITVVESTGYFGSVKRTLRALVDRRKGTILGLYDFTLFANQNVGR